MPASVLGTLQSNLFSFLDYFHKKSFPHVTDKRTGAHWVLITCWYQTLMSNLPGSAGQPLTPVKREEKILRLPIELLPGLRTPTYLSNREKRSNEYCDKPTTAKMPHYYPSQGFQNQDLSEVKEEEPQIGIEQIHGL